MPLVVLNFLQLLFSVLMLLVIARVIVSWLAPSGDGADPGPDPTGGATQRRA